MVGRKLSRIKDKGKITKDILDEMDLETVLKLKVKSKKISDLQKNVADQFKRGLVLSYNQVSIRVRSVSIAQAVTDGAFHFVPVSVNFQTFTDAR